MYMPLLAARPLHRFLRQAFDEGSTTAAKETPVYSPRADVFEEKDAFVIDVELPGVRKNQVHLTLKDDVLALRTDFEKPAEANEERQLLRWERRQGIFERSWTLEGIEEGAIRAEHADGVLRITLPKTQARKDRDAEKKIEVA